MHSQNKTDKMKMLLQKTGSHIKNFFLKTSLGQCLGIAAVLVIILEMLGFRSVWDGLLYPFTHPLSYCINTLLVALTFAISVPFKRRYFGYMLVLLLWLAMGITNCVLLGMRVTPFEAADFYIVTTGLSIVTVYLTTFQIIFIATAIGIGIIALIVAFFKMPKTKLRTVKDSLTCLLVLTILTVGSIVTLRATNIIPRTVSNIADAYKDYGFAYCFSMGFIDRGINEPDDYNKELIDEIAAMIGEETERPSKTPNVIFVQLESFFDVNRLKNLTYSRNPVPNMTKLMEQYPSGNLIVPSIGAGTANTEFEVLTGMSLDYFGMGEYPYKSVLRDDTCESLATMFKSMGYSAHAIHNHSGTFYDRNVVYANLGFDSFISSEFMTDLKRNVLTWAEDRELTKQVVLALDSTKGTSDLIFTVSVQGHGRYPTEELDYTKHVYIMDGMTDKEDKCRYEYFVNQMYEMDLFIGELIDAVNARGEETMIVFYGDHLPSLDIEDEHLTETAGVYETEYLIWSNFTPEVELPDRDLYAFQLMAYAMKGLDVKVGVTNRFHNYYFDKTEYDEDEWNAQLEALEYDMLYGDRHIYGNKNPFKTSPMRMGVVDITVTSCDVDGEVAVIKGEHFTEFSVVYVDGDAVETKYVSGNELLVMEGEEIRDNSKIQVVQVAADLTKLYTSKEYIYHK
jgi:phosphoglycerol transferase MdoB-like AlkP superfamily enzyme